MNRNAQSHFALAPVNIDIQRSQFDRSHGNTFTCNFGEVVPCYLEEVLPGDTFNVTTSMAVRLQTLLKPVMGNMYLETMFFFVPNRLIWDHWQNFCGESNQAWTPSVEYTVPQIRIPNGGFSFGSLADYLGVPPERGIGSYISHLPFRAYAKVIDDWFINRNLEDPLNIYTGDAAVDGSNALDSEIQEGSRLYIAGKYHDLFTSCLPGPLRYGSNISIPVNFNSASIPVMPTASELISNEVANNAPPMRVWISNNNNQSDDPVNADFGYVSLPNVAGRVFATNVEVLNDDEDWYKTTFTNLGVDTSLFNGSVSTTVNDMRMSFAVQRFYEKLARGGDRYISILKSMFNVESGDARLQRSEYLGGNRIPISVSQITNNAETESSPLGNLGAMSLTNDKNHSFIRSFVEHGYVIGVCVARYEHSYPQGLPKLFKRKDKFDFYWPTFANISEQPIFKREIFMDVDDGHGDDVFGYQEPWAHYRYGFNSVHGEMRPDHPQSLASWNLADDYEIQPSLSREWAMEDKRNVDRTLAVSSSVSNQILIDMWFNNVATRPMPMYSIPGLIDHH